MRAYCLCYLFSTRQITVTHTVKCRFLFCLKGVGAGGECNKYQSNTLAGGYTDYKAFFPSFHFILSFISFYLFEKRRNMQWAQILTHYPWDHGMWWSWLMIRRESCYLGSNNDILSQLWLICTVNIMWWSQKPRFKTPDFMPFYWSYAHGPDSACTSTASTFPDQDRSGCSQSLSEIMACSHPLGL